MSTPPRSSAAGSGRAQHSHPHPAVLLRDARERLTAAGLASPEADARTLLADAAGVEPGRLLLLDRVTPEAADRFAALVQGREEGIPVQHLTGRAWFRRVEVAVGPGVFVPRPETEVMTGWAIDRLTELGRPAVAVELCTGSGAIAKALADEAPDAEVHAVELSEEAMAYAVRNLTGTGVDLRQGDMADAFPDLDGRVDLVIANPPYIPLAAWDSVAQEVREHEPDLALWSGQDGLDALRVVAMVAARLLRPGGLVCAEHAEVQAVQAPGVLLADGRYDTVRDHRDLAGRPRFVTAVRR